MPSRASRKAKAPSGKPPTAKEAAELVLTAAPPVVHPSGEVAAEITLTACKNAKRPHATFADSVGTLFATPNLVATFVDQVVKCSLDRGFIMPPEKVSTGGSIGDVSDSVGKYAIA
jgi:hypothetical protein